MAEIEVKPVSPYNEQAGLGTGQAVEIILGIFGMLTGKKPRSSGSRGISGF